MGPFTATPTAVCRRPSKRLRGAGLDSIRVSINSCRSDYYDAYYRPHGYHFDDLKRSIQAIKTEGGFASINYLVMPGVTDEEAELAALSRFIEDTGVDLIQMRNLNIDPEWYLESIRYRPDGTKLGVLTFMERLRRSFPHLQFGYLQSLSGTRSALHRNPAAEAPIQTAKTQEEAKTVKQPFDVAIIGAGIVGLATAMKLVLQHPHLRVAVVEKESAPARHQTGHNSGVIHSGLYYRPGSLKAHTCVNGARQLQEFCREHGVPFEMCGKVVVATEPDEIPRLQELHRRGLANGVAGLRLLNPEQLREIEPHAAGLEALQVDTTGIIDFAEVARVYARVFEQRGGTLLFGHAVRAITGANSEILLHTSQGTITTRGMINCSGLYSDRVARLAGIRPPCRIVPFRGEYYALESNQR